MTRFLDKKPVALRRSSRCKQESKAALLCWNLHIYAYMYIANEKSINNGIIMISKRKYQNYRDNQRWQLKSGKNI